MSLPFLPLIGTIAEAAFGLKPLKYFVDSTLRAKVRPVPGSVVYCDLTGLVEHSGIYVGDGQISNIVVERVAESEVQLSDAESFTSKSLLGRKIYVSCDADGAVGHKGVARRAQRHVGNRAVYGLVVKNCHQFSAKCLDASGREHDSVLQATLAMLPSETWEPTMAHLKRTARKKLGASKWRLWDWQQDEDEDDADNNPEPEPDWQANEDFFKNMPLNPQNMQQMRQELQDALEYEQELADEDIPAPMRQKLQSFRTLLQSIEQQYEAAKGFLAGCGGASFSYADLQACSDDFSALAAQLQGNAVIADLARKMGRNYIAEEKKKRARVPQASKSEVHGTQRSDDVMRLLPSELVNLEDETLEALFYARLLEKNLLTYELSGTMLAEGEHTESTQQRTGPVVACLDTSGSMSGQPMLKAKALLLAIGNILKAENRSLHVLLFSGANEIREFSMEAENRAADLLRFLQQGFGGGTDFETPLRRACQIIRSQERYKKADVLMISDGDCSLSGSFAQEMLVQKTQLDFSLYTVLCAGSRHADGVSDEVVVL